MLPSHWLPWQSNKSSVLTKVTIATLMFDCVIGLAQPLRDGDASGPIACLRSWRNNDDHKRGHKESCESHLSPLSFINHDKLYVTLQCKASCHKQQTNKQKRPAHLSYTHSFHHSHNHKLLCSIVNFEGQVLFKGITFCDWVVTF